MRFAARVSAGVVVLLVLVIGLALFASPGRAAAETTVETGEPVETVTTELEPGWNLAGWTEPAAPVETIFESIPELRVVYSWDADFQRFRLAMRADPDDLGDLGRLTPGMGLWLFLAGDEPVTWTRPIVSEAGAASLREGWNVVLWAGEDGSAARDALVDIDDILADAFDVDGREPLQLRKGQVYWLNLTGSREWNQVYLPPRIEFLADFSQEEQVEVRAHVDDVVAYFSQRLGIRVSGLTVRYPDPDPYPCGGYYHDSVITVGNCLDVFAHEYVHAIQDYMAEGGEHPPRWFREGHAEFWATLYADARGTRDYVRYLHQLALPSARAQGFVHSGPFYYSYHVRTHALVKREGPDALNEFIRKVAERSDWRVAFEDIYGMTVDEFNVVFAQEMLLLPIGPSHACPLDWYEPEKSRSQAPEQACGTIQGVLTDLTGNPRSGVLVGLVRGALRHKGGLHDAQQTTESDGEFSLTVPEGSYKMVFIPERLGPSFPWVGAHYYNVQMGFLRNTLASDWINSVPGPGKLVIAYGAIAGHIFTDDGEPASGILARLIDSKDRAYTDLSRGAFQFFVGSETYVLEVNCSGFSARRLGWYGGEEGLVQLRSQATPIVLQDADITDLSITLPAGVSCQ